MSDEPKVSVTALKGKNVYGDPIIRHVPISQAIIEVERGTATCPISLDDLKKAQQKYLFGEENLEKKVDELYSSLSFFVTHKPKIDKVIQIVQMLFGIIRSVCKIVWIPITAVSVLLSIFEGGKSIGLWK